MFLYLKINLCNFYHEYPILDVLNGFQERLICITITEIDDDGILKYLVDLKYEPAF